MYPPRFPQCDEHLLEIMKRKVYVSGLPRITRAAAGLAEPLRPAGEERFLHQSETAGDAGTHPARSTRCRVDRTEPSPAGSAESSVTTKTV